jgi:hypothetical protein
MFKRPNLLRDRISEDDIIRDWSLEDQDKVLLAKITREYRLWFAVQVCSLRSLGQFFNHPNDLESRVIGHLCKQLRLPMTGTVEIPQRDATRTDYKKMIFDHLQFIKLEEAGDLFKNWLENKIAEGFSPTEQLVQEAEQFLIKNKIILPTHYRLTRAIHSMAYEIQEETFNKIYSKIPPEVIQALEETLKIIEGKSVSWFQIFKEYPGSSTIKLLMDYLNRYTKLSEIDLSKIDLSDISPSFAEHLYKLTKYYGAGDLKRFRPAKRYTMMLAFLSQAKKILTDYTHRE